MTTPTDAEASEMSEEMTEAEQDAFAIGFHEGRAEAAKFYQTWARETLPGDIHAQLVAAITADRAKLARLGLLSESAVPPEARPKRAEVSVVNRDPVGRIVSIVKTIEEVAV